MDEKNNDSERKREAPMSISHSAKMGSNGVSLPEFRACKSNNNLVLLKSLIQKKPQKNSRMKRVPTDNNLLSKLLNRNRPQRDSARKKRVLAVAMTEEGSREDAKKLVGSKIKVWWPCDKQFYEGIV